MRGVRLGRRCCGRSRTSAGQAAVGVLPGRGKSSYAIARAGVGDRSLTSVACCLAAGVGNTD